MKSGAPQPINDAPAAVMRAASAWLARRDRGFTVEELAGFEQWRTAHTCHAAAIAQLEGVMATFDHLPQFVPTTGQRPDPDFFAPRRPARVRRRWWVSLGATALATAAAVAILLMRPVSPLASPPTVITSTEHAAERTMLSDGSTVILNRNSRLDVVFSVGERRVRLLRGEAHFAVAKNPARPFVVAADGVTARAVGTAFNVRRTSDSVEVLVTEGRVQVDPAPAAAPATAPPREGVLLHAGYHTVVPLVGAGSPPQVSALSAAELARRLAWQPQLVELVNATLADAVAEFNRRKDGPGHVRLVIGDADLADLRIGGSIFADQPDAFVRLLERSFEIRAERTHDTLTLRRAR